MMVLQAALFYLPYKVHNSYVQQSSKIIFLCPKWIHTQPLHQVWFFLEGGLIGNFGRDGKAPVSWPKLKTAFVFHHFLIKISFPTRWWSVWSAVTTTGWWWRRLSRSSSSTSSPSSITTPGTLSTLSHVGHSIVFRQTIEISVTCSFHWFDSKYVFDEPVTLQIWSKFCSSWNTLHLFRCLFSRRACKLSASWRPNIFHRSLLGQEICMVRKKIKIIEDNSQKVNAGTVMKRWGTTAPTQKTRDCTRTQISATQCAMSFQQRWLVVVLLFPNPLVHVSSCGSWTSINLNSQNLQPLNVSGVVHNSKRRSRRWRAIP